MRMLYLWFSLILLLTSAQAAEYRRENFDTGLTEPASTITLQDALSLALSANPEISVALREREAIEGVRIQAATNPNPTISTMVEDTRHSTRQTTLQLDQPFELGNKRAARMEAAAARSEAATAALDAKKSEIHANVIAAFYTVLAAQERVRLTQVALDIATQAREAASKRVLAGKISPVEETKSRVAESGVKIEASQAANALTAARKRLTALWGNPLPKFLQADGEVERMQEVPPLETLSSQLDSAPLVKSARLEIETRQALANVESTRRTPNLTVSVGARRNEELGLNQAVLGLSIPIPVFDRNQGNLQEAISRTDKARDELTALRVQLATQLAVAYERLDSARAAAQILQSEILPGAQSAFDAANKGFQFGKFSYLDVLDAQRTLFQAKSQYVNALLEAHQAVADIQRIVGSGTISPTVQP